VIIRKNKMRGILLIFILSILTVFVISAAAQDSSQVNAAGQGIDTAGVKKAYGWKISAMTGLNFSSTSVSSNWAGSEQNTWGLTLFTDGTAERQFDKLGWKSRFNAEYGQTKSGQQILKSSDLLHTDSYLRWKVLERFNPYVDLTFDSQFDQFLRPMVLSQSLGMSAYILNQPKQVLSTRAGLALKEVYDPADILSRPLNVVLLTSTSDSGSTRFYFGTASVTNYDLSAGQFVKFSSELRLFAPINFEGLDMRFDNSLYFKLSKYLTFKVGFLALYNYVKDYPVVWPRDIRTKTTTGLGLSWSLF
jgi:hypothetical protein